MEKGKWIVLIREHSNKTLSERASNERRTGSAAGRCNVRILELDLKGIVPLQKKIDYFLGIFQK